MKVLVVGSCLLDFVARPTSTVKADSSNEGDVHWGAGGAGRNVAENLTRLGLSVTMVTDLGEDFGGRFLQENLAQLGIETRVARRERTGVYLAILNPDGSLEKGFCTSATERILPDEVLAVLPDLNDFSGAVLDANLSTGAVTELSRVLQQAGIPYALETTAHERSRRVIPAIPGCALIKPDRVEAWALTGLPCDTAAQAETCADRILAMGAQRVIVSLGADGFLYQDSACQRWVPADPVAVADVTGAGDALFSTVFAGILQGHPLDTVLKAGCQAAALTCASSRAVSEALGPDIFKPQPPRE